MVKEKMFDYIAGLPIEPTESLRGETKGFAAPAADLSKLPDAIVAGSNMTQFPPSLSPEIRSSVALSLLAAQRVATGDPVILTPKQWVDRHNTVLTNLFWLSENVEEVTYKIGDLNAAVHQAIIPFLTAAFGPFAAAGALVITALKQLQEMDKDSPWITLFDHNSRHFDARTYQFSVVQVVDGQVHLRVASARFSASSDITHVLFVKIKNVKADFDSAARTFCADATLLAQLRDPLMKKLGPWVQDVVQAIPEKFAQAAAFRKSA